MRLDFIRGEIERLRVQIRRQQKEIVQLQAASINTLPAEALLARMKSSVENLCAQRDKLVADERLKNIKVYNGTPASRRA